MASDHRGEVLAELKDFGRSNLNREADCDLRVCAVLSHSAVAASLPKRSPSGATVSHLFAATRLTIPLLVLPL